MNLETGTRRNTVSNEKGHYFVPFLQPGSYRMIVSREGFMAAHRDGIRLGVEQEVRVDVILPVAMVSETVQVVSAELLDLTSAGLGTIINEEAVQNLPLNGRNFTQLMTLSPGVTPVSTSQGGEVGVGDGRPHGLPGSSFSNPSFGGQRNRSAIYYLDGLVNTDFRTTTYAILPNIDLIEEFRVHSHSDHVEFGGVTGGIVHVVSRSGGNEFHGSAHEFVRNDIFDARDPFKDAQRTSAAPFRQNQFGAALGGPILKSKTFFSGGYDGWRYRKPTQSFGRVPTVQELLGDFSNSIIRRGIYDPFTTREDADGQLVRDPFPNNRIPVSLISPMTQGFLKAYAERPNYVDPVFNFIVSQPVKNDCDNWQIRIDHQVSEGESAFFRWSQTSLNEVTPQGENKTSGADMSAHNIGGAWLHVFGPRALVNLRGGYSARAFLLALEEHRAGLGPMRRLGFTDTDRFGGLLMNLLSPWGEGIGIRGPAPRGNPVRNVAGDLTWIKGNHSFKTGFQWVNVERLQINTFQTYEFNNDVTAHPQLLGTTGASLASALLGLPVRFYGYLPDEGTTNFKISTWSAYFQDEWRVNPDVTVNAGLRFDYTTRPTIFSGLQSGPNLRDGTWLIGARTMPPPCNQARKAPCIPGNGLHDVPFGHLVKLADHPAFVPTPTWDNWGPRIGIAWRIGPKTVVRSGYGLHWDALPANSQYTQHNVNNWPQTTGFSGVANGIGEKPRFIQEIQGWFPAVLPEPSPWNFQGWGNDPDRKNAYSHQWNIEIQRQMSDNLLFSVAYVGSANRRLEVAGLGNSARTPGPGTPEVVNQRRPHPHMTAFFYSRSIGESDYSALQVKAQHRFAKGLQTLFSYTWSKSIDTGSSGWFAAENGPGGSAANQNFYDINSSRSVSSFNIPHFLSWYAVYELPMGRGKRWLNSRPGSWLLGNWQVNYILQARSGQPYNLRVTGDVANIGNPVAWWNYARPNLVGDPRPSKPTAERWYNPDAFAVPRFEYGNFGRNVLSMDGVFNMDLSLLKKIPMDRDSERRLELRFEAFNVFNVVNLGVPGTLVDQAGAGRINSVAAPPRELQFGLKFYF